MSKAKVPSTPPVTIPSTPPVRMPNTQPNTSTGQKGQVPRMTNPLPLPPKK